MQFGSGDLKPKTVLNKLLTSAEIAADTKRSLILCSYQGANSIERNSIAGCSGSMRGKNSIRFVGLVGL